MEKKSFRECTLTLLDRTFGLRRVFSSQVLDQWLQNELHVDEAEKLSVKNFQELLILNSDAWNEQELSLNFIGPIFALARFSDPYRFNLFSERKIGTIVSGLKGDVDLSGEPDGIIATGYREPEIPMFAFSEYKRELDPTGDPAGQALAAMLVGQTLNQNRVPVYGAYVVGSDWRFMILEEQHYAISRNYSALSDEIFDILRILKGLKQIVMDLTAE